MAFVLILIRILDFKAKVCHELSYIKINIIKLNQKITLLEDSSKQKNEPDENLTSKQYEEVMKKLPLQKQEDVAFVEAMVQAEPEFKSYLVSEIVIKPISKKKKKNEARSLSNSLGSQYSNISCYKFFRR